MTVQRTSSAPPPASAGTATSYGRAATETPIRSGSVGEPLIDPSDSVPDGDLDEISDIAPDLPADRFSNRELSWLSYNARVLAQAEDPNQPLLERLKFLAIFASNLDEFYMVRVAGLKRRADMGLPVPSADGLSPREVLAALAERTRELGKRHALAFRDDILPVLEAEGIHVRRWEALDNEEKARLADYFRSKVFPVLTPLAVDPGHPFPYISGLSLNLAVLVRDHDGSTQHFARVKVPNNVPRFVVVSQTSVESEFLPL
ncbi:MAG: RNA degradosome polyphosphate kinase, partial [Pseudonocardiales bacterium]